MVVPSLQQVPFLRSGLELISSYNGIPFFSSRGQQWVQSRTGEKVVLSQFYGSGPPWQNGRNSLPGLSRRHAIELPCRSMIEEYLDIYQTSVVCLVFPLVDSTLFLETISLVYHPLQVQYSDGITGRKASKASIFAFLAFCSIIDLGKRPRPAVDDEAYAAEAQRLLSEVMQEPPTLDGLQSLLMLVSSLA